MPQRKRKTEIVPSPVEIPCKKENCSVSPSMEIPWEREDCSPKTTTEGTVNIWPIAFHNFSKLPSEVRQCTSSSTLKIANYQFKILVYPNGMNENCKGYTSIFLRLIKPSKATIDFSFSILFGTEKCFSKRHTNHFDTDSRKSIWGWGNFANRSNVMEKLGALKNDQLVVLLEIFNLDILGCSYQFQRIGRYERLLNNEEFSDMTIAVQEKTIHANKIILSSENDVFAAMLEQDAMEAKKSIITIEDVEFEVMLELIRFIYVGQVRNIEKMPKKLLIAAVKYGMNELKVQCGSFLSQILSIENVIDYLNFADLYRVDELRKEAISFFMKYKKDIVNIPDFRSKLQTLGPESTTDLMTDLIVS